MVSYTQNDYLSRYYPVEDTFLKDWFARVILAYEKFNVKMTSFHNYEINYEFGQDKDYVNKIAYDGNGGATLTTKKMIIEYHAKKGFFCGVPTLQIIQRKRKKYPNTLYNLLLDCEVWA